MKFAICNEMFDASNWTRDARLAREIGYTGLEVAPFTLAESGQSPVEISKEERRDFRNQVADCGMEIIGLHWLLAQTNGLHMTIDDPATRTRTQSYLSQLIDLCSDLGGSVMVLGSPQQRNFPETMSHDQANRHATDLIIGLTDDLSSKGITLAIEPLGPEEGNFLNTASAARELVAAVNHPHVQLHLDVKAMSTEATPVEELITHNSDVLTHFHANDPNRLGPGMGDVDFKPILSALKRCGYDGWISVEVFDYSPGVEKILRTSMQTMQGCL